MLTLTPSTYRIDTSGQLSRVVVPALLEAGVFHGFGLRGGLRPEGWPGAAGHPATRLVTTSQIHSDRVLIVANGTILEPGDGLVTDRADRMIGVFTADCLPVLLAAPQRGVVAAIHAGWRGLMQRIVSKTVALIAARWSVEADALLVALGPCIGACCFEVGEQVLQPLKRQESDLEGIVFPSADRSDHGKAMVDLRAWAGRQLADVGVSAERIFPVDLCTRCHPALFSSFRRDGRRKQEMFNGIMRPVPAG
jgi:YfiH family protein